MLAPRRRGPGSQPRALAPRRRCPAVVAINGDPRVSSVSPSGTEVRDRGGTADALNPDILDPPNVRCNVVGGGDHLRREGLIVTVTGTVEVCEQHDGVLIGGCGLQGLRRRSGALEGRAPPELDRVPANAFAAETPGQRALADVARAAEAAPGLNEPGVEIEGAAAGQEDGTGGKAADLAGVEAEPGLAVARRQC